jgi:hypothetical protein
MKLRIINKKKTTQSGICQFTRLIILNQPFGESMIHPFSGVRTGRRPPVPRPFGAAVRGPARMAAAALAAAAVLALAAASVLASAPPASAGDIVLPPPITEGGLGLFSALKKRSSVPGGDFSAAEVTLGELSTVLWAASGLNRGRSGWTVPMAKGLAPYVRIHVAAPNGVFLYDWAEHKLVEVSGANIKADLGAQAFVRKAWFVLILSSDKALAAQIGSGDELADDFIQVLAGAMTQNIYLAAAALNLGARYIHSMREDAIRGALDMAPEDYPVALMMLGK